MSKNDDKHLGCGSIMKWDTNYLINFIILDTWLVLNSLGFIADGMYNLDVQFFLLTMQVEDLQVATMWKETMMRMATALLVED